MIQKRNKNKKPLEIRFSRGFLYFFIFINMKKCSKCQEIKNLDEFTNDKTKKSGKRSHCKFCQKKYRKQSDKTPIDYQKKYYEKNRLVLLEKQKLYKLKNKEEIKKYQNNYRKERLLNDLDFKLNQTIRSQVSRIFGVNGFVKNSKTFDILGYNVEDFKNHLENLFSGDMSWSNHGQIWEIDHIIPVIWFIKNKDNFQDNNDLCKNANALSNLRPLLKPLNRIKGSNHDIY